MRGNGKIMRIEKMAEDERRMEGKEKNKKEDERDRIGTEGR